MPHLQEGPRRKLGRLVSGLTFIVLVTSGTCVLTRKALLRIQNAGGNIDNSGTHFFLDLYLLLQSISKPSCCVHEESEHNHDHSHTGALGYITYLPM